MTGFGSPVPMAPMRNYSLPRCEQFRELVLKMAAEGASLSAIGRAVGTGKRHVKAWLRRNGVTREFPIGSAGEKNPRWNGGRLVHPKGYILIYCPSHPHPNSGRYVFEHLGGRSPSWPISTPGRSCPPSKLSERRQSAAESASLWLQR